MKDLRRVGSTLLGLLLLAGGCVAPSPPAAPPAAAPQTSAQAGGQTIVAIAPAAAPQQTLPQWLGVNDLFTGMGGLCQAKHQLFGALFPQLSTALAGLEPPPAIKSLTDPANLGPDAPPGVKDVAQVKADEDAAPQKIAAIKYAAGIGCVKGHPGIERAFLQFLDDPTEAVRYEAAKGLAEMIGTPCETCPAGSCCTPKIYKKLNEIVTREKSPGCYVEYSDRVRRMARIAMHNCGAPPPEPRAPADKIEGPGKMPLPKKEKIEGPEPPPAPGISAAKTDADGTWPTLPASARKLAASATGKDDKDDASVVQTKHQQVRSDRLQPVTGPAEAGHYEPALMVQWERVSVPYANFSSHKEAFAAVGYLRARVLGARLLRSPGFRKDQVSVQTFDWTDLNTVTPSVLARTLKSLPIGQVSPILKDRQGYHLVRVLKRQYRHAALPAPEPANGPIIQTGGSRTVPSNVSDEKWPPDFSGDSGLRPMPKLPVVDENADRPPLPEPETPRVEPKVIDDRPGHSTPEERPDSGSAFPTENATPKTTRRETIQGFDPFPADPKPQNRVRSDIASPSNDGKVFGDELNPRRPAVSPATHWNTTQPGTGRFQKPRTVERIPDSSRIRENSAGKETSSRILTNSATQPRPAARRDETNASPFGRVQIATPSERRPERTVPTRPIVQEVPERPTVSPQPTPVEPTPGVLETPGVSKPDARPPVRYTPTRNVVSEPEASTQPPSNARPISRTVLDKLKERRRPSIPETDHRPSQRSTPRTLDVEPAAKTRQTESRSGILTNSATDEPRRQVVPLLPTPRPTQAAESREPERKAEPKPRRRGNVTIQTGRRSPMRVISVAPSAAGRRTWNDVNNTPARRTVQTVPESNPKAAPKKQNAGTASSAPRVGTRNRYGAANTIRYVPADTLRKRNASRKAAGDSAADGKRPASTAKRSQRKHEPIYFSRSGSRTSDSGAEPEADRK